jgi:hypothetical protein
MRIAEVRSAAKALVMAAAVVAAAVALAGCVTNQQLSSLAEAEGASVVFESIDGPPRPVSTRLARSLDQEAAARRLVVLSRGGQALYHIRGYVAASAEAGGTVLSWAFDVYDAERRRAFRINGEERANAGAWSAADDDVLQRIASNSVGQIMAFIAADRAGTAVTAQAAAPQAAAVLAGPVDDFSPEASGIVRMFAPVSPAGE